MTVIIRVDANKSIGMGHLMRCFTLAKEFKRQGHHVSFACYELHENASKIIGDDFNIIHIGSLDSLEFMERTEPPSVIIVDHYELNIEWHHKIKEYGVPLVVVDDLANRKICADIILNQNVNAQPKMYQESSANLLLLGLDFTLLREEFVSPPQGINNEYGLLISMGGADGKNQTPRILRSLEELSFDQKVLVLIGATAKNKDEIIELSNSLKLKVDTKTNSREVAKDLLSSELCIGAGGISSYERVALAVPTMTICTADNQVPSTKTLAKLGVLAYAGIWDEITDRELLNKIKDFLKDKELHGHIATKSLQVLDKKGAKRSVEKIIHHVNS